MKLFKIKSKNISYDEDVSMVILSNSEEKAIEIAKNNWDWREGKDIKDLTITEINQDYEQIVDVSHYGD